MQRGKDEMRATDDKIDVSEGEHVVKVVGSINGLQYCQYRNEEEYTDSIISAVFKLVCLDLMWEDTQTKGRLKIHQVLSKLFHVQYVVARISILFCINNKQSNGLTLESKNLIFS